MTLVPGISACPVLDNFTVAPVMKPEPFKSVILIMPVLVPELGVMDDTTGTGYFVINPFVSVAL